MGQIVYVLVCEDRHAEDRIDVYLDCDKVLQEARNVANSNAWSYNYSADEELNDFMKEDGWIFYSSIEDCCSVRVEQKELQ
jgi:hypothetical protein